MTNSIKKIEKKNKFLYYLKHLLIELIVIIANTMKNNGENLFTALIPHTSTPKSGSNLSKYLLLMGTFFVMRLLINGQEDDHRKCSETGQSFRSQ